LPGDREVTVGVLISAARYVIGAPFQHQGRGVGGVDCIGVLSTTFALRGIDLAQLLGVNDNVSYGREPSPFLLDATQRTCRRLRELRAGAVLLFKMPRAEHPHHFALYTDKGTIIHAESIRTKQVVEQTFGRPWTRFLHSIWAIPGVDYPEDRAP